ncbi:hypothetical protein C8J57DRAFT_1250827 [Mycena rebaudengoi]|nr:hypothetical protein C8J57DRAFT_1250827 [Mycena rebaudengoi]
MALYFHWLHDLYVLPKKMSIDWESNKSWQNIRLLFGADPVVPYNENSLYSLYCMAYKKSNFELKIKQYLPRHMLGYLQEKMGSDTAKLGWSRGTYMDTYAPALPKNVHKNYDPIWCHVRDPESFLSRKCPNAESILEKIEAIYQVQPKSALFKLPALQNPDVRNWMSSVFPVDLKRLKDSEKEPLDLARIQNEALRLSLEEVRVQLVQQTRILERMKQKFERRTAVFSPAKGYSNEAYVHSGAANLVWPPIFGQKYVAWPEIFSLIHDPQSLFGVWKPSKSLNEMTFTEVWKAWSSRKFWERFREIPEWIETETSINSKSPEANWRHSEVISQNGMRQQLRPRLPSDNLTSGNGDGAEATSSSTIPSKRKAPVVSRAKSDKFPKSK